MQEQAGSANTNLAQPVRRAFTRVRPQQVYIISREKRRGIKIGISVNPRARLSGLQIAASERLTLERTFQSKNKVASAVEAEFKSLLAPLRMQGEWFSISADFATVVVEAIVEDCAIKRAFVSRFIEYELAEDECGYPLRQAIKADYPELYWRSTFEL